jgi:hypothetical protein
MGEQTSRLGLHKPTEISELLGDYFPDIYAADLQQIDDSVQIKNLADVGEVPVFNEFGLLVGSGIRPEDIEAGLLSSLLTDWGMLLFRGETDLEALSPTTAGKSLMTQGAGASPIFGYPSHSTLTNLTADTHSQYLNNTRHDLTARHGPSVVDHGSIAGLADDDHPQYIKHALALAESDFLVASGAGAFVKKTLAEAKTILGIQLTYPLEFVLDGGGSAIETGAKMDLIVPAAGTILSWTLVAQPVSGQSSGSITIDVWKCSYADFAYGTHPVDGDSIVASVPVLISNTVKGQDSTLSGWTKSVAQKDVIRLNVDSCSNLARVTVLFEIQYA